MKNAEDNKVEKRERTERHIVPENLPSFYTNSINVSVSIWDLRITLGRVQVASEKELVVQDLAEVYMSPQHAKALLVLLETRLRVYEQKFGVLPDVSGTIRAND